MIQENEFGYRTRQILNRGVENLSEPVAVRLQRARQAALNSQRKPAGRLQLAAIGQSLDFHFGPHLRTFVALVAVSIGVVGSHYWSAFQQALENEEIDSALLIDDLPPSAFLDRGFDEWLERDSASESPSE